jgi:hypothetical protein
MPLFQGSQNQFSQYFKVNWRNTMKLSKSISVYSEDFGSLNTLDYEETRDCLIVLAHGSVCCPLRSERQAKTFGSAIAALASSMQMTKVVALECFCDEETWHSTESNQKVFRDAILKTAKEFLWLKSALREQWFVSLAFEKFELPTPESFEDAKELTVWLPPLVKVARNMPGTDCYRHHCRRHEYEYCSAVPAI